MLKFVPVMVKYEFTLLKYMPLLKSDVAFNIGVLLVRREANKIAFAKARFRRSWEFIRRVAPDADIEYLTAFAREAEAGIEDKTQRDELIHRMFDSFSNNIQLSETRAVEFENDPELELSNLVNRYCTESINDGPPATD